MAETKALGPAVEGTIRAIPNNSQLGYAHRRPVVPFAYEVEPAIPIVLHAKKYFLRQSQS